MAKHIKILIACGSGIATSTIAADHIKEICETLDISAYEIIKCSMTEIGSYESNIDLILTTNNYDEETTKPHMNITGFLTGINEEALREAVRTEISHIYEASEVE